MESEINEFFKKIQNLSEDEQIKQLERQLDKILDEIENLMEEIGKEEKLKYVDQKIETISAKL
jgi:ElaB/YqjD/DUF883 family membrane-anchored ribosome-binding protein